VHERIVWFVVEKPRIDLNMCDRFSQGDIFLSCSKDHIEKWRLKVRRQTHALGFRERERERGREVIKL
jgi:hypothetical protein